MKIISYIIMSILLLSIAFAVDVQTNSNPFNITFTGNQNQSFILPIPQYSYVRNVSLNLINLPQNYYYNNFDYANDNIGWITNGNVSFYSNGLLSVNGTSGTNAETLINVNLSTPSYIAFNFSVSLASGSLKRAIRFLHSGNDSTAKCTFGLAVINDNFYYLPGTTNGDCSDLISTNLSAIANNFYFIEFKNIDYSTHLYDIYVNNTFLMHAPLAFNNFSSIDVYNEYGSTPFPNIYLDFINATNGSTYFNISKMVKIYNGDTNLSNCITPCNTLINTTILNNLLSSSQPINLTFHSDTASIIQINLTNATSSYGIDNCTNSFNIPSNATALNVSYFDSNNASLYTDSQSTTTYLGSSFSLHTNFTKQSFCIYPNWFNISQQTQFLYTYAETQYSYFLTTNFNNNTQFLNLFTNSGTSQVLFTVLDLDGNALANYTVQILQYNVGTGTYTITEAIKTDSNGHALGNIILNSAYYNFLVYDTSNALVKTLTGVRVTAVTYQITVSGAADKYYIDLQNSLGVNTNVYYNNDTSNFVFTWSDPTGEMHLACLRVVNQTYLGSVTMSDTCTESSAGTIVYGILPQNDTQYLATAYLKYDFEFPVGHAGYHIIESFKLFQTDLMGGLFAGFLLLTVGILIGLPNPVISMVYFCLVFIVDVILGLFKFVDTANAVGIGIMSSIVLLGIIVIYIGGKQQ